MSLHESFWTYKRHRYLKVSIAATFLLAAVYTTYRPPGGHNGGTWLGYALGTLAALLILWLTWFGVRKRSYHSAGAPLRGWLSAHVYLGVALLALVPLHSGFQFGWNVHTLAYALMAVVIVSGLVGVGFYSSVPELMTENRPGEKLEALLEKIADIDTECRGLAASLPDKMASAVALAVDQTRVVGGLARRLSGSDRDCATSTALRQIAALAPEAGSRDEVQQLLELLNQKRSLLHRVRRDLRLKALLDLWLAFHIPFAVATLAAVSAHVFLVFYYR